MRVLVATTCAPDDRMTLAAVRSLARSGAHVAVGGGQFRGQAFASRYISGRVRYPHPGDDFEGFRTALAHAVRDGAFDVALPTRDAAVAGCVGADIGAAVALPPPESLAIADEKHRTLDLARRLGIGVPETHRPETPDDLRALAAQLRYPCVVKLNRGSGAVGLRFLRSKQELLDSYEWSADAPNAPFEYARPLIQEYLPGPVLQVGVLCRHGELRAAVTGSGPLFVLTKIYIT